MRPSLVLFPLVLAGCLSPQPATGETLCGAGTTLQGTTCVATSAGATCGLGTVLSGTECIPAGASISCGEGTALSNGKCIANGTTVTCGSGTVLAGVTCVPSGATVTCGAGTTLQGTTCVASGGSATCGPGTVLSAGKCIVDPSTKKGFRDSCIANADCGCYAAKADDPACTVSGGVRLICKHSICTLDCTAASFCTGLFPVGTTCNLTYSYNYCM